VLVVTEEHGQGQRRAFEGAGLDHVADAVGCRELPRDAANDAGLVGLDLGGDVEPIHHAAALLGSMFGLRNSSPPARGARPSHSRPSLLLMTCDETSELIAVARAVRSARVRS